ncbi:hypothetical protein [Streptomyces sp. NPDC093094]|uniref:hypothetical protein n=1 Tax=Streptomyces sp. NPDC093094 TaxID=3366026 RepID=UPI0037FC003A
MGADLSKRPVPDELSEYPELALGEPLGAERRLLDAYGITGKPEELDPGSAPAIGWAAAFGDCRAATVAEESSVNPATASADKRSNSSTSVAVAPALEQEHLLAGSEPLEASARPRKVLGHLQGL